MVAGIMIAGSASGVGKTSLTAGLVGALRKRGLVVQPFKVGPDYIDPSYHTAIAGRACRNLDSWMVSPERLRELYQRATVGVDIAIVEGVMGLFDGLEGQSEVGSSAEVAKLLNLPVVLVFDAQKMARSAAALVKGYAEFDPDLRVVGAIANRVGGIVHRKMLFEAMGVLNCNPSVPIVGALPTRPDLKLPERHLGLVPAGEGHLAEGYFADLIAHVEESVDVAAIVELANTAGKIASATPSLFPAQPRRPEVAIAVAQDEAFCFYYQDNLDLLEAWGATIVPFSPMRDAALPAGIAGIYLGGGFPELFAGALAENRPMLASLRSAFEIGMPIYAECGGYMYLCQTVADFDGKRFDGVGLVPANAYMRGKLLTLGYREVRARDATMLLAKGQTARGHEFHWSALDHQHAQSDAAYDVIGPGSGMGQEGYQSRSLVASYVHMHFASNPSIAPNFVANCAAWNCDQVASKCLNDQLNGVHSSFHNS